MIYSLFYSRTLLDCTTSTKISLVMGKLLILIEELSSFSSPKKMLIWTVVALFCGRSLVSWQKMILWLYQFWSKQREDWILVVTYFDDCYGEPFLRRARQGTGGPYMVCFGCVAKALSFVFAGIYYGDVHGRCSVQKSPGETSYLHSSSRRWRHFRAVFVILFVPKPLNFVLSKKGLAQAV
jgi:hypothetical protein